MLASSRTLSYGLWRSGQKPQAALGTLTRVYRPSPVAYVHKSPGSYAGWGQQKVSSEQGYPGTDRHTHDASIGSSSYPSYMPRLPYPDVCVCTTPALGRGAPGREGGPASSKGVSFKVVSST